MYGRYCKLRDLKGLRDSDIAKMTGITQSTFSDWKKGKSAPNAQKLVAIARILETTVDYLVTGETPENQGQKYYFSDETARVAQELFENKDLRILFDAARDAKPEDLKMAADMLKRFKGTNDEG